MIYLGRIFDAALKKPLLQVALDFTSIRKAILIAKEVYEAGADILEVGTPLIKSVGISSIKEIRKVAKDAFIVADMKTIDVGALETRLAMEAGADATTVLGVADDEVIASALEEAKKFNGDVIIDLISHKNPLERIHELMKLNVKIVNYHVGIDVQIKRGLSVKDRINEVKSISSIFNGVVSISGGIKPFEIPELIKTNARIFIIGSAITKSKNPMAETLKALKFLR